MEIKPRANVGSLARLEMAKEKARIMGKKGSPMTAMIWRKPPSSGSGKKNGNREIFWGRSKG